MLADIVEIDLTTENPWRPVDWRWRRAQKIHEKEFRKNKLFDTPEILGAVKFLDAMDNATENLANNILAIRNPSMYWAIQLHNSLDNAWRAEVEARILTGESEQETCNRMGMRPEALAMYEKLFYDVRNRMRHSSYILHIVIGQALHRGLRESDWPLLWKFYGYTYGPKMLDIMVKQSMETHIPQTSDEAVGTLRGDGKDSLLRKQALAARLIPVNSFTQMDILTVYAKFTEIDRIAGLSQSSSSESLMVNVQKMLSQIPIVVGDVKNSDVDSSVLASYDSGGTELPDSQLFLAANNCVPNEYAAYGELIYPEPIHHESVKSDS